MRDWITPQRTANTIRMQRSQYKGTFLLVEGEKDKTVYKRFIDQSTCRILAPFQNDNKNNIVEVLKLLSEQDFEGLLAILDADFWVLEHKPPQIANLVLTDTHDLETMMLKSPALEKLLDEWVSEEKAKDFVKKRGKDIRTTLLEMGELLGYLRWVSLRDNYRLSFQKLDFKKLVILKSFVFVSCEKMIKVVKNNTIAKSTPEERHKKYSIDEKIIEASIRELKSETHDRWHVCCGHDLLCILSIGLRRVLGNYNAKEVDPEVLERELRLAYESSYFVKTDLYKSIEAWELANQPFNVLGLD